MKTRSAKLRILSLIVVSIVALGLAACDQGRNKGSFDHPAFGERQVYITGADGYLYSIDKNILGLPLIDGEATAGLDYTWRELVGDEEDLEPLVAGPALNDDPDNPLVLVASEDGNLYAYDAAVGGGPLWIFPTGGKIWSTPVIKNGVAYFGSHDKNVYAVNVVDGTEKWRYTTGGAVAGRPLLFNSLVIVGSFDKKLYGLDAVTGELRWPQPLKGKNWFWAGAVADESTIYAPSMDGHIYAVDRNGNLSWKCDMGSPIVSRPALISGALLVAAKNGRGITVLDTGPASSPDPNIDCAERRIDYEFVGDAEIKAPLFAVGTTLYAGTQGSTIIRLDIRTNRDGSLDLDETWCFNIKKDQACQ